MLIGKDHRIEVRQAKLVQTSWTIQPGQRLTTGPEQNFARKEVTNYVKPKGWRIIGHNASEGIEPRNDSLLPQGQGFHALEASSMTSVLVSVSRRAGV